MGVSGFFSDTVVDVAVQPRRRGRPRKKDKAQVSNNSSTNEVNGMSNGTQKADNLGEELTVPPRSGADESSLGTAVEEDANSIQIRIHTLTATLADTRAALQSGREALWESEIEDKVHILPNMHYSFLIRDGASFWSASQRIFDPSI
jgi:hypothetical protein